MQHVLTLIADPATAKLTGDDAALAHAALAAAAEEVGEPEWLAERIACDLAFTAAEPGAAEAEVAASLANRPIDVVVQKRAGRRKALLVADMESTVIENEMVDELGTLLGVGDKVADITRRAMNGEIGFRPALRERAALLGGLEEEALYAARELVRFVPGAHTLVRTMRANGAYTAVVSGGFDLYSAWVAERAGFDTHLANRLEIRDGIVTGAVAEPVLGKEAKREALVRWAAERNLALADTMAVGDGANDVEMLRAAGCGVAFRAKPAVARAIRVGVVHGDLTALLYIQGYRRDEFVEATAPA